MPTSKRRDCDRSCGPRGRTDTCATGATRETRKNGRDQGRPPGRSGHGDGGDEPDHPRRRRTDQAGRCKRHDSRRGRGHRPLEADRAAGAGRRAHAPGDDLQGGPGEQHLLPHLRPRTRSPLRAIQAASNALQLLASGFTVIRDVGNNAMYADTALRAAIEQGWLPGPTIIPSGLIIGGTGGQFTPTPEMYKLHNLVYPEYLEAEHAGRDRQGRAREPAVRSQDDQDLRRLQAVGLLGRRHQAVHRRSGQGWRQGGRPRPDAATADSAPSTPAFTSSRTASSSRRNSTRRWRRRPSISRAPTRRSPSIAGRSRARRAPRTSCRAPGRTACRSRSRPTWTTGTSA